MSRSAQNLGETIYRFGRKDREAKISNMFEDVVYGVPPKWDSVETRTMFFLRADPDVIPISLGPHFERGSKQSEGKFHVTPNQNLLWEKRMPTPVRVKGK